jgi:hypothetical protein
MFQENNVSSLCQFDLHISTFHGHLSYHLIRHHVVAGLGRIFLVFLYVDQPVSIGFSQQCNGALFVGRLFVVIIVITMEWERCCDTTGRPCATIPRDLLGTERKEIYLSHET